MKTKRLLPILTMAAMVASCSQEEFIMPENANENLVENGFSQYVGVPFEGEVSFSKGGDAETRMGLTENLNYKFVDGDKVGLVWLNSDAISNAIANYDVMKESEAVKNNLIANKIVYANAGGQSNPDSKWDAKYTYNEYNNLFRTGAQTPAFDSYVWTSWPGANWKVFSNTRMTYEEASGDWHMTDGQIFKGLYIAYYPYNQNIQSTQKFRVQQDAEQKQNTADAKAADYGYANHILNDMVWVSQRIGDKYIGTGGNRQDASFVYALTDNYKTYDENDNPQPYAVNIKMRPFSNILDTRIYIKPGDMSEENANKIKIESVELIAKNSVGTEVAVFPTIGAFQFGSWGTSIDDFGVYGEAYDRTEPKLYTWKTIKANNDAKYVGEDLVTSVETAILNQKSNNGQEQRVQLMLLPGDKKETYTDDQINYTLRITTDYGYIEIPEYGNWYRAADSSQGVVVNPSGTPESTTTIVASDLGNTMNEMMTMIGVRKTRGIDFKASDLNYNRRKVCDMAGLMDAIRKWNELGKKNETFEIELGDCTALELDNFVWSTETAGLSLTTSQLDKPNQPNGDVIEVSDERMLGELSYASIINQFLANGNQLKFNTPVTLTGNCGIDIENNALLSSAQNLIFANGVTLADGAELILVGSKEFEIGSLTTENNSQLFIANEGGINLKLTGASALYGETTIYEQGQVEANATLNNYGTFNLNGKLVDATNFTNNGTLNIYAKAQADGKITNTGKINYNDIATGFARANYDAAGAGVYAFINESNSANHGAQYLEKANAFGVSELTIDNVVLGGDGNEWVNNTKLANFKTINLTGEVELHVFNDIQFTNAVIYVDGTTSVIGHNDGGNRQIDVKQFILKNESELDVKDVSVVEITKTEMWNNTILKGYDNFKYAASQPTFKGTGTHEVYNQAGDPLFNN